MTPRNPCSFGKVSTSLTIATALCAAGFGTVSQAALVTFESPTYTAGGLQGQDGWDVQAYGDQGHVRHCGFNHFPAERFAIRDYDRIQDLNNDIARDFGAFTNVSGNDILFSFKHSSDAVGRSAAFLDVSRNGDTPVWLQINGSDVQADYDNGIISPTTLDPIGDGSYTYTAGNILEWNVLVDFSTNNYTVSFRDITLGTGFSTPLTTSQTGGMVSLAADTGIFVGLAGRDGSTGGRFDDLSITQVPEPATPMMIGLAAMSFALLRRRG